MDYLKTHSFCINDKFCKERLFKYTYKYICAKCGFIAFGTIDKPSFYDTCAYYNNINITIDQISLSCDEMMIKNIIE